MEHNDKNLKEMGRVMRTGMLGVMMQQDIVPFVMLGHSFSAADDNVTIFRSPLYNQFLATDRKAVTILLDSLEAWIKEQREEIEKMPPV